MTCGVCGWGGEEKEAAREEKTAGGVYVPLDLPLSLTHLVPQHVDHQARRPTPQRDKQEQLDRQVAHAHKRPRVDAGRRHHLLPVGGKQLGNPCEETRAQAAGAVQGFERVFGQVLFGGWRGGRRKVCWVDCRSAGSVADDARAVAWRPIAVATDPTHPHCGLWTRATHAMGVARGATRAWWGRGVREPRGLAFSHARGHHRRTAGCVAPPTPHSPTHNTT